MAKDNNLQDFLTDIADAIREKKGTTDKINPQDFATEIANLSSGGGSGSGESGEASSIEYLDVSGLEGTNKAYLVHFALYVKAYVETLNAKFSGFSAEYIDMVSNNQAVTSTVAIAIDFSHKVTVSTGIGEFAESTIMKGLLEVGITQEQLDAIPRITKDQFYSFE